MRKAVLAYVRTLLWLQGLYLLLAGWLVFIGRGPDTRFVATLGLAVAGTLLGGAEIVTAVLLSRGRVQALAAIVIQALWTAAAVAGYLVSLSGAPVWQYFAGAALFLAGIAGLLLPSVRAFGDSPAAESPSRRAG